MNSKILKELRKIAKIKGDPSKSYLAKKVPVSLRKIRSGQLPEYSVIIINDPKSVRGIYRKLKKRGMLEFIKIKDVYDYENFFKDGQIK